MRRENTHDVTGPSWTSRSFAMMESKQAWIASCTARTSAGFTECSEESLGPPSRITFLAPKPTEVEAQEKVAAAQTPEAIGRRADTAGRWPPTASSQAHRHGEFRRNDAVPMRNHLLCGLPGEDPAAVCHFFGPGKGLLRLGISSFKIDLLIDL